MLEVEHVSEKFKDHQVLVDVNLKGQPKGMSSLFWVHLDQEKQPSFAALTTWKRQIQDTLTLGGKEYDLSKLSKRDSRNPPKTAFVFQHYNLFANKTALENILEGLVVARKIPKKKPSNGQNQPLKKLVFLLIRITILLNCQVASSNGSESRVPSQ